MADSVQAAAVNFPPGFRFRPSDEEIVGFYLKNKVQGIKFEFDVIREIDLYKCEPWDLPEKSYLPTRDPEWYFFCPRDRKYPNGSRSNRATVAGYWKATGKDRKVSSRSNKIGTKKTLVFYRGRAPHGERTDWLMHEYRLEGSQLKGGTNLQDLYVLSRVFRKTKQGLNNQEPNQEVCLPISNNPLSPTDVSDGDIEDQSEERSSPAKQEEDTLARSETSSEILDNKVEDNNCIDGPVESFQDISNPSRNLDDPQQGNQDLQYGPFYIPWEEEVDFQQILSGSHFANNDNLPGNQMNSSGVDSKALDGNYHGAESFDDDLPFLLDGFGNLFEVDAYLFPMTMEEGNNDEPCVAGLPTSMPDDNVHIHIRSRPQSGQSHQQPLPSQGTAKRRVRMGVYRTEEPPDGKEEHPLTVNAQSAFSDDSDNSDESEVITQHEDSLLEDNGGPPVTEFQYSADDADSDIFNDSVESSERLANGHDLNLAPTQLLASLVLPIGEASEKSEMPVNSKESGDESVLIEKSQSVMSSGCSQSLSLAAALIPTIVRDESGSPKEHFNDLTGNDLFTSLKREQALIGESEQVQKCIVSENESRLKAPGQVCELIEDSLKGEKLACGISSTEVQMEMTISGTSSQEMELVSVKSSALGTESPTVLASKKVTASEVAASFGLGRLGATGSNNNAVAETHMSHRGSGKFTGFNFIFSGLKLRGKSRAKSSDHVEESRNVTEDFSDRCSKDSWKVFSSLEKVLGISIQPSQLQSKTSKGANCILLICLLSTALLVLFMWNKWHLIRSSSSFILQQRS